MNCPTCNTELVDMMWDKHNNKLPDTYCEKCDRIFVEDEDYEVASKPIIKYSGYVMIAIVIFYIFLATL